MIRNAVVTIAILTVTLPAYADEWKQTFVPPSVETYLEGEDLKIIVVAAGEDPGGLAEATLALEVALRAGSKVNLVMNAEALGDVKTLDDQAVVAKAADLPVAIVAIIRVFPSGDSATAVVTFYDKQGKVIIAFTAQRGTPLAARSIEASAGKGVDTRAAKTVGKVLKEQKTAGAGAIEEYQKKYLWFAEGAAVHPYTGRVMATWSILYRGKYKQPIEWEDFYNTVGRKDLADEYNSGVTIRTWLVIGGIVVGLAGTGLMFIPLFSAGEEQFDEDLKWMYIGGGVMLVGSLVALFGAYYDPQPVGASEARRLADEYNQRLMNELGLSSRDVAAPAPMKKPSVGVSPFVAPGGGGLMLGVEF
jgi:hypothetical protein